MRVAMWLARGKGVLGFTKNVSAIWRWAAAADVEPMIGRGCSEQRKEDVMKPAAWKRALVVSLCGFLLLSGGGSAYAADYVVSLPPEPTGPPDANNDYNCATVDPGLFDAPSTATFNGGATEITSVTSLNPDGVAVGAPYQLSNGNWNFDAKSGPKWGRGESDSDTVLVVTYKDGKKRCIIFRPLGTRKFEIKGQTVVLTFIFDSATHPTVHRTISLTDWLPRPPVTTPAPVPNQPAGD